MEPAERSERHSRILDLLEPARGKGLEVGPLFDPVVRRHDGDVVYVDVHAGPELKQYYAEHPGVPLDDIIDPDFVLIGPDGPRPLPVAVSPAAPFDWAVASHVIEHVPDIIGWLDEMAEVLEDGGRLVLAVPDRRFSFDAARPPTTVGEMLLAHRSGDRTPSVRAVYDHHSSVVSIVAVDAWKGEVPLPEARIHDLDFVLAQVDRAVKDGEYVDCHVWLFTPASFVQQLAELGRLDLTSFAVERVVPTAENELEFYVRLRRIPRGLDADQRAEARAAGVQTWADAETRRATTGGATADPLPATGAPPAGTTYVLLSEREARLIAVKRGVFERARRLVGRLRR
jgi:SAM-dependent methyltransferase